MASDRIKSFYDTKYSNVTENQLLKHDRLYIHRLYKWLAKNGHWPQKQDISLLDAGCGLGNKTFFLSYFVKSCLGIDISRAAIDFCEAHHKRDNLSFALQDISDVKHRKFDVITAFGLSWFNTDDMETLADRLHAIRTDLLNPKGYIIATTKTDFSGGSPSGWYYFTQKDIDTLREALLKKSGRVSIACVEKDPGYLMQGPLSLMVGSLMRRIRNKPLDLIIIFENG